MLRILITAIISASLYADIITVSTTPEWKALLLINDNNKTEIDDQSFYLSKLPIDPIVELNATIQNISCENICRFPARYTYLAKQLDINISYAHCKNLNDFLERANGDSAHLIFASSFIESPVSYFGHTFIKLNKPSNPMFSWTLGYAAELENTKFTALAKDTLQGNLRGVFIAEPFFKLYEEYVVKEQRTLHEYPMNLNEEEIKKMLLHFYELGKIKSDYDFFKKNCAYWVYSLINSARSSTIKEKLSFPVLPKDSNQILTKSGFLTNTDENIHIRSADKLYMAYRNLTKDDKAAITNILNSDDKKQKINNTPLNDPDSVKFIVDGAYDILFKKYNYYKSDHSEIKTIRYVEPRLNDKFNKNLDNGSSKLEIAKAISNNIYFASFQPILLDRISDKTSEISEASLGIAGLKFKQNKKLELDELDIINIESLNTKLPFYNPPSWMFDVGLDKELKTSSLEINIGGGIGKTFSILDSKFYILPHLNIHPLKTSIAFELVYGISYWLGDKTHIGFDAKTNIGYINKNTKDTQKIYLLHNINNNYFLKLHTREHEGVLISVGGKF